MYPSDTYDDHFSIANIPFGIASRRINNTTPQVATRLHSSVYFIPELIRNGHLDGLSLEIVEAVQQKTTLNKLASLGRSAHRELRSAVQTLLRDSVENGIKGIEACSTTVGEVEMHMPVQVGDFSDFSSSRDHVLNAGEAVLGQRVLPPGFLHFPVGYGGRASSLVVSGTPIRRPLGQYRNGAKVEFGPSRALDFELEVACIIGKPSKYGQPVRVDEAENYLFGFVLLNDWSARDIQGLEMNPLGPFLGKSFGTSISPWVVMSDALEPFRCGSEPREGPISAYLTARDTRPHYSVQLRAEILAVGSATTICESRLEMLYWSFREMIAHQTINGCSIRSGDILATGTVSGSSPGTFGCLLEITKGGKQGLQLHDGQERIYLEDGDGVRLTAWAGDLSSNNCVGFGACVGTVESAIQWS